MIDLSKKENLAIDHYTDPESINVVSVRFVNIEIFFSYKSIVAFKLDNHAIVVSENMFSRTSGKHINQLLDRFRTVAIKRDAFIAKLERITFDVIKQEFVEVPPP